MTNNPGEGTGFSLQDAANAIEKQMDSDEGATGQVDADTETSETEVDEVSDTLEDEAGDEIEGSDETDEYDEAEDSEEAEGEQAAFTVPEDATVTLPDGSTVSGKELLNGYWRQADYTRKTQELAQERKAYVQNRVELTDLNRSYANNLNQIQEVLYTALPELTEPDWDDLRENDPHTYLREQGRWEKIKTAINAMNQERDRIANEERKSAALLRAQAQQNAYDSLVRVVPEFKDPAQAKANLSRVESFLRDECHFEQDLIDDITDPRYIVLALDALQWREHKKKVPQAIKRVEQKPAITPGTGKRSAHETAHDAAMRKLKRTGSIDDAVQALLSRH